MLLNNILTSNYNAHMKNVKTRLTNQPKVMYSYQVGCKRH